MKIVASRSLLATVGIGTVLVIAGAGLAWIATGPLLWAAAGLLWWVALMVWVLGAMGCVVVVGRRYVWACGERWYRVGVVAVVVNRSGSRFCPTGIVSQGIRATQETPLVGFRSATLAAASNDAARIARAIGVEVCDGDVRVEAKSGPRRAGS